MGQGPIRSANQTPLNETPGTLPNMQGAIADYLQNIVFTQIFRSNDNHEVVESREESAFMGAKMPLKPAQLAMKPEGQRAWKWFQIFSLTDLELDNDDVIEIVGTQFRVMGKSDWHEYGYFHYEIVEDYQS